MYVEIVPDSKLFATVEKVLADVQRADNEIENFMFTSYNQKCQPSNKENFDNSVISSSYDYTLATILKHKQLVKELNF